MKGYEVSSSERDNLTALKHAARAVGLSRDEKTTAAHIAYYVGVAAAFCYIEAVIAARHAERAPTSA